MSREIIHKLVDQLSAEDRDVREDGAFWLAEMAAGMAEAKVALVYDAVPALVKALSDAAACVRAKAATALGMIGCSTSEVMSALLRATEDEHPRVRGSAVSALPCVDCDPHLCLPVVIRLLQDPDPIVK